MAEKLSMGVSSAWVLVDELVGERTGLVSCVFCVLRADCLCVAASGLGVEVDEDVRLGELCWVVEWGEVVIGD